MAASVDTLPMSGETSLRRPEKTRLDGDVREIVGGQRIALDLQGGAKQHTGSWRTLPGSHSASAPGARHCRSTAPASRDARRCGREMAGQRGYVAGAVAQRRNGDAGRADPLGEAGSKSSGRDRLDVAISRTSTEFEPLQPTGRTSPVASTRSRRFCVSAGSSPISSSSKVPPSAWTMLPIFSVEGARKGAGDMAEQGGNR